MAVEPGARHYRALLARLKPLADEGMADNHQDFARQIDIRPRNPKYRPPQSANWPEAQVGRISITMGLWANFERAPTAIVFCEQIGMSHHRARATFQDLFGNSDVHHSPTGKGWWMTYAPAGADAMQLIATFDNPRKGQPPQALFSCAMLMPR